MSELSERMSGPDPRRVVLEGQRPRLAAVYHCQRCVGAAKTVVRDKDYVPIELMCSRCGNRIPVILRP